MPRSDEARVGDMLASCVRIRDWTRGMSFEQFRHDDRTLRAVLYELVVIGEAAKSLGETTRRQHPTIPWKQIAGMRDIVVHQYHGIMVDVVSETAAHRIPELERLLRA